MSPASFALQALDDEGLAESTGEGIAVLPEKFSMVMQEASNTNPDQAFLDNRANDTGYIRLIPVGPLTPEASASGAGKADIFLYGFAISQSNKNYGANRDATDWNNRFGRNIDSWGSAINPWLLKVTTENDVPNFSATSPTDSGKGDVTYLMLEAPLYDKNINALSDAEKSAYNLKLGAWADIFVRDPKVKEDMAATGTQFDLGGANRANRLRLQAVWDGLSINGSNLKLFQTLGGATNQKGMSTFYNNTLGMAGTLRLNSGDGETVRAIITENKTRAGDWQMLHDGNNAGKLNSGASCNNGNAGVAPNYSAGCQFQVRKRETIDTSTKTITPSSGSVLRLSTRETGTGQGLLSTPAINGGQAPTFDNTEGLFIYNLNVNLVLGSLYQPLTVGTDGNNITLELARIPNKESIYKKVYTNYANSNPATNGGYYGSTCNIYKCGNDVTLDGVTYQGSNATHSSISIGSTVYNAATNSLEAYKGEEAIGISFGSLNTTTNTASQSYTEVESRYRQQRNRTWKHSCNWAGASCTTSTISDWEYKSGQPNSYSTLDPKPVPSQGTNPSNDQLPTANNRNWGLSNAIWMPATNAALGYTNETSAGIAPPPTPTISAPVSFDNNFGSAVIDGLLIQHMKITTKGL